MGRWRSRPAWGSLVALVLVVPALAAGCSIRALPEPPSTTAASVAAPTTTVATVRGTTVAARAFLLDWGGPGSPVRPAPVGPLPVAFRPRTQELGDDRVVTLVLVFPLLRSRPGCVRRAELWLRVLRFDHPQAVPVVAAYPSLLASLATDRPVTRVTGDTLIDNRPRGTGTLTADGSWMHFDITGLYRTWVRGGPFPSQGRAMEPRTPLVVDVRPEAFAEPWVEARFAGLKDRHTAPHLRWRVTRDC
jgi:hypothetical protein